MKPHSVAAVETRLCACGCGDYVKTTMSNGHPVLYKPGHHRVKNGEVLRQQKNICPQCKVVMTKLKSRERHYCSRACYWETRGIPTVPSSARTGGPRRKVDKGKFHIVRSPRLQRKYMLEISKACADCGWDKYPQILELHHINHDKTDGRLKNLKMICPTCHEVQHFLEKSGRHDGDRYRRARKLRESLGLVKLPSSQARTTMQRLMDEGRLVVN